MPVETPKMEKPPSPGANGGAAMPFSWAESFMETIGKYGRNSERHLYVYGISVSRCAVCRQRLSEDAKNCEHCGQEVSTKSQACTGCKAPAPGIWCYECDLYFCEPCHRKPHGLVLGGDKQAKHHCYAVDGSSGTLLRYGSFSDTMLATMKAARRAQMKLRQDNSVPASSASAAASVTASSSEAKPTDPSPHATFKTERMRAEEKTACEKKLTAKGTTPMANRFPLPPGASAASVDAALDAYRESRKRKAPTVDLTTTPSPEHPQRRQHPPPAPQRAVGQPPLRSTGHAGSAEGDGRSLYDKLKHQFAAPSSDRRIKSEAGAAVAAAAAIALRSQQTQSTPLSRPTVASTTPSVAPSPTAHTSTPSQILTMSAPPPRSISAASTPTASAIGQANRELEEALTRPIEPPPALLAHPQLSPPHSFGLAPLSTGSRSASPTNNGLGGGSVQPLSSAALSGDPLEAAVVEGYDRLNKYVASIEDKLKHLSEIVVRMSAQNVAHAAQISERMRQYRTMLVAGEEQRYQALAKVILFSSDLRAFASSLATQQLGDIPQVLTSCHVKCATLAHAIEELKNQQQQLRATIDAAVNSGDVTQLLGLQSFSEQIQTIDAAIQQTRKDRDGQFQLMYQFSKRLRDAVRVQHIAVKTSGQRPPA